MDYELAQPECLLWVKFGHGIDAFDPWVARLLYPRLRTALAKMQWLAASLLYSATNKALMIRWFWVQKQWRTTLIVPFGLRRV
jgi:hypothetical protein